MAISDVDRSVYLARLASIPLSTEDDVREEFLTPLLRLLGYDHARGEITRGRSLSTLYQSGTKRKEYIVPDYITTVGGISYLVLDAKDPSVMPSAIAYVGQVHSYASHREVNAPQFIVSNGLTTLIFKSNSESFQPIFEFSQSDIV